MVLPGIEWRIDQYPGFLMYRFDVPVELGDGGSRFNDPPPTSEPTEGTRHPRRIADRLFLGGLLLSRARLRFT